MSPVTSHVSAPVVVQVVLFSSNLYAKGTAAALALPFVLGLGMAVPWPLAGAGIAYLPRNMTAPYLADGRLLPILAAWCVAVSGVYIYYPSRRQMPATLQAFIDFARRAAFAR